MTLCRPRRTLTKFPRIAETLVVLMPPPVPLGEAPMSIASMTTTSPGAVMAPMGMVLNPAVDDALTIWKADERTRSPNGRARRSGSEKNRTAVPAKNTAVVIARMTLEVKVSIRSRSLMLYHTSWATMNPIAPMYDKAPMSATEPSRFNKEADQ
jgi:hypothetical protein